eukprot:m.13739 g.13739  ORF g.13739 m.13739 type:complete len:276 (-) comp6957_c1_seq1:28-855(-)
MVGKQLLQRAVVLSLLMLSCFLYLHTTSSVESPFKGQLQEDMVLYNCLFGDLVGKTYVEIGALDGVMFSNTFSFEALNDWTGLLIEADPWNFSRLRVNRPYNFVMHRAICPPEQKSFTGHGGPVSAAIDTISAKYKEVWYSGDVRTYEVPCITFAEAFQKAGIRRIEFFSLVMGGAEEYALKTMDWSVEVGVWLVKLDKSNSARDQRIRDMLKDHGYEPTYPFFYLGNFTQNSFNNEIFVSKEYAAKIRVNVVNGVCGRESWQTIVKKYERKPSA